MSTRPHLKAHGEAHTGKESKVHNGEDPYPHPDVVSPAFLGALTSRKPHFRHPILATNDLRDLLNEIGTEKVGRDLDITLHVEHFHALVSEKKLVLLSNLTYKFNINRKKN